MRRSTFDGASAPVLPVLLLAIAVVAGCSTSLPQGNLVDEQGNHPAGFVTTHSSLARPAGEACASCHGNDLRGGIANVSCFSASRGAQSCHANGPAFHPANWVDTGARGTAAWHGDAFLDNVPINGFRCSGCHDLNTKCTTCHFTFQAAPVRRTPVGSSVVHNWTTGQVAGHSDFGVLDVPNGVNDVCIACHETNNRFGNPPHCHNCHSPAPSFHTAGWANPGQHGTAAKDAPTFVSGFPYCQACHGANFGGQGAAPSCVNNAACHGFSGDNVALGVNAAPHSPRPWRTSAGTPRTHTTTASDTGNAAVCGACHRNRANTIGVPVPNPPYPGDSFASGCFNSTLCHGNTVPHPIGAAWRTGAQHGATAKADLTYCQACHAEPASPSPGSNPRFNIPIGALAAGCEDCHRAFTAHPPVDPAKATGAPRWYFHRLSGNKTVACPQCHGANLQGPAEGGVGPRCQECHALGPPLTSPPCTTCHLNPPSGVPDQFPNFPGKHSVHNAFNNVTGVCESCHNGAGFGSGANHFVNSVVEVAFLSAYAAKTGGAAAYTPAAGGSNANGGTCANVSCHGGQATPNWRTAVANAIDVNTQCTSCHRPRSQSDQFNSQFSGDHGVHSGSSFSCTECHDMTLNTAGSQNHFRFLDTSVMEGPARDTYRNTTGTVVYTPTTPGTGTCAGTCHGENHPSTNPRTW